MRNVLNFCLFSYKYRYSLNNQRGEEMAGDEVMREDRVGRRT